MPTLKDVIYKVIKPKSEALAEYYREYREEEKGVKGYYMKKLYEGEYNFWYNEITLLRIPDRERIRVVENLHNAANSLDYITEFETNVLPILVRYWTFDNEL